MIKQIFILLLLISSFAIFSCQREPLEVLPEEETPPPVNPTTCVLDTFQIEMKSGGRSFFFSPKKPISFNKIQYIDSSETEYLANIDSFVFDNQKRLITKYSTYFTPGLTDSSFSHLYITYNSNSLPVKVITEFFTKDNPAKRDSLISFFNYTNNKLVSVVRYSPFDQYTLNHGSPDVIINKSPYISEDSSVITWTGENVSRMTVYYTQFVAGILQYNPSHDFTFEYDLTKTNFLNIHKPFTSLYFYGDMYNLPVEEVTVNSKNLLKKIVNQRSLSDANWEDLYSYSYTYTFNSNGDVSKIYKKSDSNLHTEEFSLTFSFFPKCQ